jgi:hypothetical protein
MDLSIIAISIIPRQSCNVKPENEQLVQSDSITPATDINNLFFSPWIVALLGEKNHLLSSIE